MIAAIVGKPKFIRFRMERQPDRVANPACINFGRAPIDRNGNDRAFKATDLADIARCPDRNKQAIAVWRKGRIAPAVMAFIGQICKQDARRTKTFAIKIGKVVRHDTMLIGNKQGPRFIDNAVGLLEIIRNQIDLLANAIAVFITDKIKIGSARADKNASQFRGYCDGSGVGNLGKDRQAIAAFST